MDPHTESSAPGGAADAEPGPPTPGPPTAGARDVEDPRVDPDGFGPAERARRAGASDAMARWVGRIDRLHPTAGRVAGFVASVYGRYSRHRGAILAGGLAFFATLSLVPALLSLGALVAVFYDPEELSKRIEELLAEQPEVLATLMPVLDQVSGMGQVEPRSVGVQGVVSLVLFLYAASRFVYVVRQVLDTTFELHLEPPSLLSRGIALMVTILIQLAVVALLLALGFLPRLLDGLRIADEVAQAIRSFRAPLGILVAYALLTTMMRFGVGRGRRIVRWANLGSLVGALIIVGGTAGLSWYLAFSTTYATIIATLGGVIALEIWLFLVGVAIVISAEVEAVRADLRRPVGPAP